MANLLAINRFPHDDQRRSQTSARPARQLRSRVGDLVDSIWGFNAAMKNRPFLLGFFSTWI